MSESFKVFSAAVSALQSLIGRDPEPLSASRIDGVQHRVAVLHIKEGRIIEHSARLNGC